MMNETLLFIIVILLSYFGSSLLLIVLPFSYLCPFIFTFVPTSYLNYTNFCYLNSCYLCPYYLYLRTFSNRSLFVPLIPLNPGPRYRDRRLYEIDHWVQAFPWEPKAWTLGKQTVTVNASARGKRRWCSCFILLQCRETEAWMK